MPRTPLPNPEDPPDRNSKLDYIKEYIILKLELKPLYGVLSYSTAQRRCPLTRRSELACALIVNI